MMDKLEKGNDEVKVCEKLEREYKYWGELSDPALHDPEKYRYLVHALNPASGAGMGLIGVLMKIDHGSKIVDESDGDQSVNLCQFPEKINKRVSLSCSLIDQEKNCTYANSGLIIKAPEESVIITSPVDAGTGTMSKQYLLNQSNRMSRLSPNELLHCTSALGYNEVSLLAGKLKLAGFFVKVTEDGEFVDDALAETVKRNSRRLGLPLVKIVIPNPYKETKYYFEDDVVMVQLDGRRFRLGGDFNKMTQKGSVGMMSPNELESALSFLFQLGYQSNIIEEIRQKYLLKVKGEYVPQIYLDDKGDIKNITLYRGYGVDKDRVSMSAGGEVYVENVKRSLDEAFRKMANPSQMKMQVSGCPKNYLSPREFKDIVNDVIDSLNSDELKQKVLKWSERVLDRVQKNWDFKCQSNGFLLGNLEEMMSFGEVIHKNLDTDERIQEILSKIRLDFSQLDDI